MARLLTNGAEWADSSTNCQQSLHPDYIGTSFTAAQVTNDSGTFVSGARSWKITADANQQQIGPNVLTNLVSGKSFFFRARVRLSAFPSSGTYQALMVADGLGSTTTRPQVVLTSSGVLELFFNSTLLGSTSAISTGTFYLLEFGWAINAGASDYCEARLDTVSFGSTTTGNLTDVAAGFPAVGYCNSTFVGGSHTSESTWKGTAGDTIFVDDIALNDSTGAGQTSWPGNGKIVLLKPISLNTNGGSWTDDAAATTSAALTNAIDNTPPNGVADTTAGGGNHQVRNAAANSSLDMNMTTYTTAGIGSTDTINVVAPAVNVGAPASTGAKSGSFGVTTNPTIANRVFTGGSGTATFFWRGAAPGTYATNWSTGWEVGTVTYGSTVTVGSSPVGRLTITGGTTTRIAMCDAMGLYVDYTPATTKAPPFQARTARNMLLRR